MNDEQSPVASYDNAPGKCRLPETWHEWFKPELFAGQVSSMTEARLVALYLTFLEETGRHVVARRAVPITAHRVITWRERIANFEDVEAEALEAFRGKLHSEAVSRAVDGWKEPVFYKGDVAGYITRKSDRILELMLKGHMPETFGDKVQVDQTIKAGVLVIPAGPQSVEDWMKQNSPQQLAAPVSSETSEDG